MWFVLNYIPSPGTRRSGLPALIDAFNRQDPLQASPLELFAPTFISLVEERGKVAKTEKPLLYHYIFVRGDEDTVKRLCLSFSGFSFVMDRAGARRHLTVPDHTLDAFRIIAQYHSGKLPCYPLEGINLDQGDKVQIVSGPCAGLTGTYISRRGGKSGNILVAIDGNMAAVVYDVKADYVRVLEFARDSKRVYDQLDAFASRLTSSLPQPVSTGLSPGATPSSLPRRGSTVVNPNIQERSDLVGGSPNSHLNSTLSTLNSNISLLAAASVFTRRLGAVKIPNPKLDAKLQALLYAAYRILGDTPAADRALARYRTLSPHITNPKTLSLLQSLLDNY